MRDSELIKQVMANAEQLEAMTEAGFQEFCEMFDGLAQMSMTPEQKGTLRTFYAAGFNQGYEFSTDEFRKFLALKRARDQVKDALK